MLLGGGGVDRTYAIISWSSRIKSRPPQGPASERRNAWFQQYFPHKLHLKNAKSTKVSSTVHACIRKHKKYCICSPRMVSSSLVKKVLPASTPWYTSMILWAWGLILWPCNVISNEKCLLYRLLIFHQRGVLVLLQGVQVPIKRIVETWKAPWQLGCLLMILDIIGRWPFETQWFRTLGSCEQHLRPSKMLTTAAIHHVDCLSLGWACWWTTSHAASKGFKNCRKAIMVWIFSCSHYCACVHRIEWIEYIK